MVDTFKPILRPEQALIIFGVPGRYLGATQSPKSRPGCFAQQKWISERRPFPKHGKNAYIVAEIRFDDECGNGHNSFSITGHTAIPGGRDWESGGCIHDSIIKAFPELANLIKWHLTSSDGPLHYLANTTYLAGNLDCNGLAKGESRQIKNGKTGLPAWRLVAVNPDGTEPPPYTLPKYMDSESKPVCDLKLEWRPWCRVGEGKERQLDAARATAVWPEATDAELSLPKQELDSILAARLPGLLADFKQTIIDIGFLWER